MQDTKSTEVSQKNKKIRFIIVLVFLAIFALISFVAYRSEYLQIKEIGEQYISVFKQNISYKYAITFLNFLIWFVTILITNAFIKKGLKKFFEAENKQMPKLPNKSVALIVGTIISLLTSDFLTNKAMLFINRTWFGGSGDPIFGQDIGYYMFQKPFWEIILIYGIGMLIFHAIYTVVYYIISFNVYFDGIDIKLLKNGTFAKQMIAYILIIAFLFSAFTLLKTQNILFEEFIQIQDGEQTALTGAGLTDVTIKLWGYRLFAVVIAASVIIAIHFFHKEKYKQMVISLLSIPGYLIVLFFIMTAFEIIVVSPNTLDTEKTYIQYNIDNTRNAYNINIEEREIENEGALNQSDVANAQKTLDNIPIISEEVTLATLKEYQDSVGFYTFDSSKLQNYIINDKEELVYITPREIVTDGISRTYENKTYNYTHGFGSIITSASKTDEGGSLDYIQVDFDKTNNSLNITEPRIYFGLKTNTVIVVNSNDKKEFDYPITTSTNTENSYNGKAGISPSFIDRAILGITKGNFKLAFIDNNSKIILNRNVLERAKKLMPYLIYDENPYLVLTEEGKQVWVLDAYTTSDAYPYSQKTVIETGNIKTKINYIRNSAKVLIDAYDGTIKFYITDRTDPIIMAYASMYENLFASESEKIPDDISKHITYPELLYNVQSEMYQRYHKIQTEVLYRNDDLWEVARFNTGKISSSTGTKMIPYYTMLKTSENEEELGLILPYTGYGKQNILSYLVGTYSKRSGLKLALYKFTSGSNVLGPTLLNNQIEQDSTISAQLNSLNQVGTKIIKNMIIVPIGNKLLYVEPVYQIMLNEKSKVQTLVKVIVASGNKVAIGDSLKQAIQNLLSQSAVNIEVESTDSEEDLINAIIKANNNLQESNENSDWEMIGKDIKRLQELVSQLEEQRKTKTENIPVLETNKNVLNVINNTEL